MAAVEIPTMKSIRAGSEGNGVSSEASEEAAAAPADPFAAPAEPIDFSKVEIEPLFKDFVDFETFSKSDFRAVKVLECEAVPKSKKLLKLVLDDGTDEKRVILSGIHAFYEPEQLIGKTLIAITNLPPRTMMGMESNGMLLSALHNELESAYGVNVQVCAADLSVTDAALDVFDYTLEHELPVDILVNNAGFGDAGSFADRDWQKQYEMVQVNIVALMQLTHCFLKPMMEKGYGKILSLSPVAAFCAGPGFSHFWRQTDMKSSVGSRLR